jgi:hypothetical protein
MQLAHVLSSQNKDVEQAGAGAGLFNAIVSVVSLDYPDVWSLD